MVNKLEVDKLSYKYSQIEVLEEVSFALQQGQFIGLIGPNGSGKSTLLKNINNILKPAQGKIYLENTELQELSQQDIAKKLAVVPQNTKVNFDFTVEEIVMMGRSPYLKRFQGERKEDFEIAKQAMKETATWQFAKRSINQLSGGEQQRVILARSLAQEPEVLLLDEPTSNLDINYQLEIMDLLKRLNCEEELTILVVLHDLNLAAKYCDKLLLINKGEIHSFGSPTEVITSENIEKVYGSKVIVKQHHPENTPYVTLINDKYIPQSKLDHKIHLICGGGTGRGLIESLVESAYQVSCGVVNEQDSDWEVGKAYNIKLITEQPFEAITKKSHHQNLEQIKKVDTVILTDMPFGSGNLLNLKAALRAVEEGKKVIVIDNEDIKKRDYTSGVGTELFEKLLTKGVNRVEDISAALDQLKDKKQNKKEQFID